MVQRFFRWKFRLSNAAAHTNYFVGKEKIFMLERQVQIRFRLTPEETLKLKRLARLSGHSVASFVRARCLDDQAVIIQDPEATRAIMRELSALGNNANQIARAANSTKSVKEETLIGLLTLVGKTRNEIALKLKGAWRYADSQKGQTG
jgi:uncharacterized protein (DUF1778 family)